MEAIYKITNNITGQQYIGSTSDYKKRMQKWRDWKNSCSNGRICADFTKYGFDRFTFEVIQMLPDDIDRKERERIEYEWIHRENPYYNEIGKPRSEATKRKLSAANKGKKSTPETVAKRSASLKRRYSEIPRDGRCTYKPVMIVETGVVYESVKAATAAIGCADGGVSRALRKPEYTVKGFHVRYLECRD